MTRILAVALILISVAAAQKKEPVPELLWPNGAPGAAGSEEADKPAITVYPAERQIAVPTAVVVCPGGGYAHLAMDHEGKQIAQWFNSLGVTAVVLKYRLGPRYHHPAPLQDAQKAIRLVRSRAAEYKISPDRIGIIGFSAGGHLSATAATHFDTTDGISSRPDFAILGYPVISFGEFAHSGSRKNLLGDNPDPKLVDLLSNEKQVTGQTPPVFLFHTTADPVVPVENSVLFYMALRKAGVPAEMHIFQNGPHGVGLAPTDATLSIWPTLLGNWLRTRGLLK